MESRNILIYLSMLYEGDYSKIKEAITQKERFDVPTVEAFLAAHPCKAITALDDEYPKQLTHSPAAPFVLYYEGDLSLVQDLGRCITIVGARDCTDYAKRKTQEIATGLSKEGLTVVSGLARGIDTAAAEGPAKQGKAVAVLGSGFDNIYPPENAKLAESIKRRGLLLSEYPPFVGPSPDHFPKRNRILAALSCATLIMEAKRHSGTLITAAFATAMARDVGALPFRAEEEFINNDLIKNGAMLIESSQDVMAMLRGDVVSALAEEKKEKKFL